MADPLRCVLESGHGGEHHGIARGLPLRYLGEVWACWASGQQPSALLVLSDCPAVDPDDRDEPCLLFNGHTGAHSWHLADMHEPELDSLRVQLERVPPPPSAAPSGAAAARSPALGPAAGVCMHLKTVKRNGKTYCKDCDKQIYL